MSPASDTFCPAIDGNYWSISTQSGNVHWCFHNIADPAQRIGKADWKTGRVDIDRPVDLSRETLRKKLTGGSSQTRRLTGVVRGQFASGRVQSWS
jgi:hypothetical protein